MSDKRIVKCETCDGDGWYVQQTGNFEQEQRQCEVCNGNGEIEQ